MAAQFPASARYLLELFPVVMLLDRELRITYASDTLSRYVEGLSEAPTLNACFDLVRPGSVTDFAEAEKHLGSLFLLRSVETGFAIRGQLVKHADNGEELLIFCGAPWLSWLVTNRPELKLNLRDFSAQDVQLDQLFYMSTEARMVADLESLNAELKDANEAAEKAHAEKNAFFAHMSHEMRTPLNGVVSALALMRSEKLGGQAGKLLELASKSSANLLEVINYVLDVSKLESENPDLEAAPVDLVELAKSVIDIVRARALEKGLEIRCVCSEGVVALRLGDENRLRQVLLNLVINAIKFTETGSVTLRLEPAQDPAQLIRFEVEDTGIGIQKAKQAVIFEAFTSIPGAGADGTGLGLDIARRTVHVMGGRIGVASAPGVGSTFWFELPLPVCDEAPATKPVSAQKDNSESEVEQLAGTVLIVDDNETNLMLGTMILESLGLSVVQAGSGEVALEKVAQGGLDLVLMDISMPGMDGYEATTEIRQTYSADVLPVVALTAYASSVERARSAAAGMNEYLTKPVARDHLHGVLSLYLSSSAGADPNAPDATLAEAPQQQVDLAILRDLESQIGMDNLDKVINKFIDEAARRWIALEAAQQADDLAREAHSLASTCRSFGLPAIADALKQIEIEAKAGKVQSAETLDPLGEGLKAALLELHSVLEGMRDASAP